MVNIKGCGKRIYVGWYWINCGKKANNEIKLCPECQGLKRKAGVRKR